MFANQRCIHCDKDIPMMYPRYPALCLECQVIYIKNTKVDVLTQRRLVPEYAKNSIAEFLTNNQMRRAQVWYLRCALLPVVVASTFHKFVYFYSGLSGNISATEDILDRILSFV